MVSPSPLIGRRNREAPVLTFIAKWAWWGIRVQRLSSRLDDAQLHRMRNSKLLLIAACGIGLCSPDAQARTTDTDGDWAAQQVALSDTREAERMIRVGDIDNLGFGFDADFIPFTGRATNVHPFPFDPAPGDVEPTDRIMVGTKFTGENVPAGQDGYSFDFNPQTRPLKTAPVRIPLASLKGVEVRDAVLCLFVDDFQAPTFKSRFQVSFNGVRFPEMEKTLNALNQTGPIGKVIYVRFTQEMLNELKGDALTISIDDPTTGAGDGYALDFAKLMVNVKDFLYRGTVPGRVVDDENGQPIPGAQVECAGFAQTKTDSAGAFSLARVPAGLAVIGASAPGYSSAQATLDVIGDETSEPVELRLKRSAEARFTGQAVREGDTITLNNIQFDVNRAELRAEGRAELDKVAAFLKQNPRAEILLSGHTSGEGGAVLNRDLSFRRVLACKAYLAQSGLDAARITVVGHGPDQPIASNDTEEGRARNRRVEMRLTRL
jgi:outer membrane protein OmpA-like peptidoglycan-associated protein